MGEGGRRCREKFGQPINFGVARPMVHVLGDLTKTAETLEK